MLMLFSSLQADARPEVWLCENEPEDDFEQVIRGQDESRILSAITIFVHLLFAWQMTFVVSDNCIEVLLKIVGYLLSMLQLALQSNSMANIVEMYPNTLHRARKLVGFDKDNFSKFVVCPKCTKLHTYEQAYAIVNGRKESRLCGYVMYPNHPQERFRTPCGSPLMKTVVSVDGKRNNIYPYKIFCYQSLKTSLQRLLKRKEIRTALGRKIESYEDYYDVYDGEMWKSFKDAHGYPYFEDKRNLGTMFNIDWFQPFDGSEHSIGVMYMVLVNLPREMRFKRENVILVGIIPGPKEPQLNVNSFLKPLVNELLSFWKGVQLYEADELQLYRLILLCISSDLPATRKCCGFLSYNAEKGI